MNGCTLPVLHCIEVSQQSDATGHEQPICDGRSNVGFSRKRPSAIKGDPSLWASCDHCSLSGGFDSTHVHGIHVPVEDDPIASKNLAA